MSIYPSLTILVLFFMAVAKGGDVTECTIASRAKNVLKQELGGRSSLLHWALSNGLEEYALSLINQNAECINKQDSHGRLPLHIAILQDCSFALIEALLDRSDWGNDDRADLKGRTPLCYAAYLGNYAVVEKLAELGCALELKNADGTARMSPINWAIIGGHADVARLLLDLGPPIRHLERLVREAAFRGKHALVQLFLEYGNADIDAFDEAKRTALYFALVEGRTVHAWMVRNEGIPTCPSGHLRTAYWMIEHAGAHLDGKTLLALQGQPRLLRKLARLQKRATSKKRGSAE